MFLNEWQINFTIFRDSYFLSYDFHVFSKYIWFKIHLNRFIAQSDRCITKIGTFTKVFYLFIFYLCSIYLCCIYVVFVLYLYMFYLIMFYLFLLYLCSIYISSIYVVFICVVFILFLFMLYLCRKIMEYKKFWHKTVPR